ncbi:MAG: hypothetical protein O3A92_07020, partial [Verrucomicrobia bacterium]|nr:hypothetical protein [Verrucomicrobiota bacterium]
STKLDRHPSKGTTENTLPNHAASYWLVYPKSPLPVTVSKELALERIKQGLPRAQRGAQYNPLEHPLLGLPDAYHRLMSYASFLGGNEPRIGIEHGDAYIFAQLRDENPDDAFLQAWVIGKKDGNIYRWESIKKGVSP